jgi:hypothetical protein
MSTRRGITIHVAIVATGLVFALGACSSSSDGSTGQTSTTAPSSTTASTAVTPLEQWVAQWRGVVATEYGPAQQEFLAAVQGGKVAEVQTAAANLLAANQALLAAVRSAGVPPPEGEAPAGRLQVALVAEQQLVQEVQRVCTGTDGECQTAVTKYGDNNSKQIVPALVALQL